MSSLDDQFPPVWDESPHDSPNIDDDLLLPVAVASFEAASSNQSEASIRKWRVTVLTVRTCWRLRWSLQKSHQRFGDSPLSRWRACAYLIFATRRLKITLPRLREKRAQRTILLLKVQSAHRWVKKPVLHVFRSTAYAVLFASMLSTGLSRTHARCAPLKEASNLLSAASNVKLDESLNSGKCKVLLQIFSVIETYLSIFDIIFKNIAKQTQCRVEGLSACYYVLKEICRLLTQCRQYIRDCSGNFPSRRLFAKLENVSTIRGLVLDIDRCLEVLSIKLDKFVEKNSPLEYFGMKPSALRLFGPGMDYYLQLQAEKDQTDLLIKLKQSAKFFWLRLDLKIWRTEVETRLLIARLEYDKKPGREIDYLKHGLCVDPKNVKIERTLGVGSFGVVQEVECFGERYAMKTIVSQLENASEAIIQAGLEHPNIVKLIWYTTNVDPKNTNNTLSLLMELMDMGLDVYLEQRNHEGKGPLMNRQLVALHILLQIARAMKYLHSEQIMHRDLKAANVLVDLSWSPDFKDGYLHVKVCDFGLSKVKQAGAGHGENRFTAKVGTRYWRAPEVLRLDISTEEDAEDGELARYSFSADVYSYAMTCYEVLTGKKPFADHKQAGLKDRIDTMNERPRLPQDCLHPGLVDLIKRCWDGRPEARPSFDVICEELEHIKEELLFGSAVCSDHRSRSESEESLLLAV